MHRLALLPGLLLAALLFPATAAAQTAVDGLRPDCGAPGDPVLVKGSGFAEEPTVTFGGVEADVVRSDGEHILCRVPSGAAPGAVEVAVDGTAAADRFTVLEEGAPVVLRLSATTVTPGLPLFLVGRRLGQGQAEFVDAGGVVQASVRLRGGHRAALLRVPETLDPGVYTLRVTNGAGLDTGDCSPEIEVVAEGAPALDSIEPAAQLPGRPVLLKGSDLAPPGPCTVVWKDASGATRRVHGFSNGYDRVHSRVPLLAETGAAYDVRIELRGGAETNLLAYTVGVPEAPSIDELEPDAGPAGGFFRIRGENLLVFGAKPTIEMRLGATTLQPRVLAAVPGFMGRKDVLLTRVPADAADGDWDVTVTVGGRTSNALVFTVGALDLSVTSMRPDHQGARGTFHPVAIRGTGFGPPASDPLRVTWDNGVDAPLTGRIVFRSDRLLLVIPPGGRIDPLPEGTYDVWVTLEPAAGPAKAVKAGTYTVR